MVAHQGVAGAWSFANTDTADAEGTAADPSLDRHITVAFIDGDLAPTASQLGQWCLQHAGHNGTLEWAGPLDLLDRVNPIDTDSYDWFDRLTPQ